MALNFVIHDKIDNEEIAGLWISSQKKASSILSWKQVVLQIKEGILNLTGIPQIHIRNKLEQKLIDFILTEFNAIKLLKFQCSCNTYIAVILTDFRCCNNFKKNGDTEMKYDNIKYHLINTINEVTKEINSLDEFSQNQIFNEDIIPDEPTLLFLNNSYYCFSSFHCIPFLLIGLCHQSRNEKKKVSVPPVYVREPTLDEVREKINDVIGFTRVQFTYLI